MPLPPELEAVSVDDAAGRLDPDTFQQIAQLGELFESEYVLVVNVEMDDITYQALAYPNTEVGTLAIYALLVDDDMLAKITVSPDQAPVAVGHN